ncbi:MAG: HAD family hydrolase [Tepidisphaeraceae bacterium]
MRPRAILFDFDGVLVNSEPLHCIAYRRLAASIGIDLTEEQYYGQLIGYDDVGAMRRVLALHGRQADDAAIARLIAAKSTIAMELIQRGQFAVLPGVEDLLAATSSRIPLGICSAALREEVSAMLQASKLRQHFTVVVTTEDVTVAKPDPSGYLLTARLLSERTRRDLPPQRCLVVEDAPNVAARAATVGFRVIGVTTTRPAAQWPADIPTVATPGDLRGLLEIEPG